MNDKTLILVVDDDQHLLSATSRLLQAAGYEVIEATTGREGLRLAKEQGPDLILLDVALPDMDGIEVCRWIRAEAVLTDSYVVLLSGLKIATDGQVEGLEAGADGYIVRPIANRELLARVETMLRFRHAEQSLRQARDELERHVAERTAELAQANASLRAEIAKRKQAEESLRESEKKYHTLFETMAQGAVYQAADGRIISANPAAERILGLSLDQMQGRTSLDPRWRAIHEDGSDFPGDTHPAMAALKTGKSVQNVIMGVFNPEEEAYTWININAVPQFRPGEDKPYQVYTTFDDITDRKQAEKELRESEEKYRVLTDNSPNGIFISDAERFIYVNQRLGEITGFSREELLHMPDPVDSLFAPEERERVRAYALNRLSGRPTPSSYEARGMRKDGEEILLKFTVSSIFLSGRNVLQGTIEDITERKRVEEQLRSNEERFRQVVSSISDHIYVTEVTEEGGHTNLYLSPHVEALTGYPLEKFLADWDFWPSTVIHPDDRAIAAAQAKQAALGQDGEVEYRFVRANGDIIWVRDSVRVEREGTSKIIYGVVSDITERKRAEAALRESEEKYRTLFEAESDTIFLVDEETGDILDANKAAVELYGYSVEEFKQLKAMDLSAEPEKTKKAIKLKEKIHVPLRYHKKKDGTVFPVEITANDFELRGKKINISAIRDITERKQAEEQLRTALEEKEALLREVHHRVKNNLQVVCALLDLQADTIEDVQAQVAFQESQNRIRSMAYLHEQLTHAENLAQINMALYVQELVSALRMAYGADAVAVKIDVSDSVTLPFDLVSPCGLLINELVSNAMKHAFPADRDRDKDREDEIRVALISQEEKYLLTVGDNGVGLPEQIELESPASLGLTLVSLLTQQLNGTLEVLSRAAGTTFKVMFARQGRR